MKGVEVLPEHSGWVQGVEGSPCGQNLVQLWVCTQTPALHQNTYRGGISHMITYM